MMHPPRPLLDRIIALESFREILAVLTPKQLALIAIRYTDDLDYSHCAEILGIATNAAQWRLYKARDRVLDTFPDLRTRVRS